MTAHGAADDAQRPELGPAPAASPSLPGVTPAAANAACAR